MKNLKVVAMVAMVVSITLCCQSVRGASNPQISVTSNSDTARAGDTVTFSFKINGIQHAGYEVKDWSGIIQYDTSVFEEVKEFDVKFSNYFNGISYDPSTKKIQGEKAKTFQNGNELFRIQFKVKQNVTLSSTSVALKNIRLTLPNETVVKITGTVKEGIYIDRQIPMQTAKTSATPTTVSTSKQASSGLSQNDMQDLNDTFASNVQDLAEVGQAFKAVTPATLLSAAGGLIMVFVKAALIVIVISLIAKYLVKSCMGVHRRSKVVGLRSTVKRLSQYTPRERTEII